MNKANLLWLDQDLAPKERGITNERTKLQPWLRYLKQNSEVVQRLCLLEAKDLETFARFLHERKDLSPSDPKYINALLLPSMYIDNSGTLELLGEPDEKILTFDIAEQIIDSLKRTKRYPNYEDIQIGIFTQPGEGKQDGEKKGNITFLDKGPEEEYEGSLLVPKDSFRDWISSIIGSKTK